VTLTQTTGTNSHTMFFDADGNEEFPCRCGETHRGDYALYDYVHHNCFHTEDCLIDIGLPEVEGYLMCPNCGQTFHLQGGTAYPSVGEQDRSHT